MLQLYIYLGSFSILSSDNTVLMVLWGLGTKTHLNEFAKRPGFFATNMAGGVLVCPLRWSVYPAMSHFQMLTHSLRLCVSGFPAFLPILQLHHHHIAFDMTLLVLMSMWFVASDTNKCVRINVLSWQMGRLM